MKTFEERYTAWIDGTLSGPELEAFERELEAYPEAEIDKEDAAKLGSLLRSHGQAPPLSNPDFFNHQLLSRIAAESEPAPAAEPEPVKGSFWTWIFRPAGWAAMCALLLGLVAVKTMHPPPLKPQLGDLMGITPAPLAVEPEAPYSAEIVSAESTDPDVSVTAIHSDKDKVTVLWMDGLDYLPASYHID